MVWYTVSIYNTKKKVAIRYDTIRYKKGEERRGGLCQDDREIEDKTQGVAANTAEEESSSSGQTYTTHIATHTIIELPWRPCTFTSIFV